MKKTFLFLAALAMSAMMWATEKTLTFDLSKNPGGWPTANSTELTEYTYTLDDVDYSFYLKNVKCNTGYLMLTKVAALGLPDIEGYKLTKVVAKNSSGCSKSVKVGISYSDESADYLPGGEVQTWATQSSSYTYTLTATTDNTVYYLYVTSANAQITELALTYEKGTTPQRVLESIYIDGTATKLEYTEGESFDTDGLKVMGKYADELGDSEITAGITWSFDPEVFALDDESVEVTAKVDDFESVPFIVNGIVVNAKPTTKYVPVAWDEIEDGGKYFITANNNGEYYFAAKAFAAGNATAIAFDASLAPEADMWIFTQDGDAWKISAADGEGLYMTNANNGLACAADKGADFTVAQGSSAEFTDLTASDGTNDRYVALYNQQDFRSYKTSGTSGIRDLKLYGLKQEGVVTKPSFTPSAGDFDVTVDVSLSAEEGADIFYALNEEVTSMNAIPYTEPITLTETTTIYAIAKKDGKESEMASKTYKLIPAFASLADLVTNMPAGENPVKVKVTITSAAIDSFYVNKSGYRNGVYVTAANTAVELFEYDVPMPWNVGGTISGTIIAEWSLYKGTAELQKWEGGWDAFEYTAPDPTALQDIFMHGNVRKLLHRGHIMIMKDNKLFNLQGQLVK